MQILHPGQQTGIRDIQLVAHGNEFGKDTCTGESGVGKVANEVAFDVQSVEVTKTGEKVMWPDDGDAVIREV